MTPGRPFGAAAGCIPRPTDRRHNVSLFVQDYVPGSDDFRLYLRALFGTGTPYTAPARRETDLGEGESLTITPGPRFQNRFIEYRRFDMGATKELVAGTVAGRPLDVELSAELLNVFNMKNTVSQSFIPTNTTYGWQAVPTRLTPRLVNVRLSVRF